MSLSPNALSTNLFRCSQCLFQGTANGNFIYAGNGLLRYHFESCLFTQVSATLNYYLIRLEYADEGLIDRCCFYDDIAYHIYGSGVHSSFSLRSASVNSTVFKNCQMSDSPYLGGSEEYTSFFNNHTYLSSALYDSCYCLVHNPPNEENINSFFSGSFCTGNYPFDIHTDVTGTILSKFNLVNNTDSMGLYFLVFSNIKTILKEFVISFSPNSGSLKWI